MKSFIKFLEEMLDESKHSLEDHEDPLAVLEDPNSHKVKKIHAIRKVTSENGHSPEEYTPHIQRMKDGDAWEQIAAINHPDSHNILSQEDHNRFKSHPNKKVRTAYEKRFGETPSGQTTEIGKITKKKIPSSAPPSAPDFNFGLDVLKRAGHRWEYGTPKSATQTTKPLPKKPQTKKPVASAGDYGVEKVDPNDSQLGYDADSVHHITKNGKVVGAVTISSHTDDPTKKKVKSWVGHPDKGFSQAGEHGDLKSAMQNVIKSHK